MSKSKFQHAEAILHEYDLPGIIADVYGRDVSQEEQEAIEGRYQRAIAELLERCFLPRLNGPGKGITVRRGPDGQGAVTVAAGGSGRGGQDDAATIEIVEKIQSFYSNNFPARPGVTCLLSDEQGICVYKDCDLLGLAPQDGGPWAPATGRADPMGWCVTGPGLWLVSGATGQELFAPFARRRVRQKARRQAEYPPARGLNVDKAIMRSRFIREE